ESFVLGSGRGGPARDHGQHLVPVLLHIVAPRFSRSRRDSDGETAVAWGSAAGMLGRSCEDLRENSDRRALESQWFTVRKVRMPTPDQMPTAEVPAPTDADAVGRALQEALEAIAAAGDLEELKTVRIAHSGDKSPLALAN